MGLFDKKNSTNTYNAKVKALLAEALPGDEFVEEAPNLWGIRNNSVLVKIGVDTERIPGLPFVEVIAFTLLGVEDDLAVYKHLMMEESYAFGKWEVEKDNEGLLDIYLVQRLLIEDLDASELEAAIMLTANTADGVDEDLQKLLEQPLRFCSAADEMLAACVSSFTGSNLG